MSTEDLRHGDARGRKQQRDRQNQRAKRRRDRATLQSLEQRNASLEREFNVHYGDAGEKFQHLWNKVHLMRARQAATSDRLKQLGNFVKQWALEEAQEWTPETESLTTIVDVGREASHIQPRFDLAHGTSSESGMYD